MSQSSSQARGYDSVPQSVICAAFPTIAEFILDIFNKSIWESGFPSICKKSLVLALNKIPTLRSLSHFRRIALLCFSSKILERLIHNRIYGYLETRKLLAPYQSGYRKGHSTQSALIKLTDDIIGW